MGDVEQDFTIDQIKEGLGQFERHEVRRLIDLPYADASRLTSEDTDLLVRLRDMVTGIETPDRQAAGLVIREAFRGL